MTETELKEIEAREEAATPGPWLHKDADAYGVRSADGINGLRCVASGFLNNDDIEFVSHSRTDIPRLIKAIRERDKRIAELEEAIESASEAVYYGYRNRAFEVLELVLRGIRRDIGLRNWEVKQDG